MNESHPSPDPTGIQADLERAARYLASNNDEDGCISGAEADRIAGVLLALAGRAGEAAPTPALTDSEQWPDERNRGLLQAAKQALSALKKFRLTPPCHAGPCTKTSPIYEASSYLEAAIKREEAWRSALAASPPTGQAIPAPSVTALSVPPGYVLVPIEPNGRMHNAAVTAGVVGKPPWIENGRIAYELGDPSSIYRAMVAEAAAQQKGTT